MSWDHDFDDHDYPTAVGAAAYAIRSLDESKAVNHRNEKTNGHDKSLNKLRSKQEIQQPEQHKSALNFSDQTSETEQRFKDPNIKVPASTSTSKKMLEKADETSSSDETYYRAPETPLQHSPYMESPFSFADKHLNMSDSKRPKTPSPKPDRSPTGWPTTQWQSASKPGPEDSMADAWEKEEMASIKQRYERLRVTIDNWEIKRKKKADLKLERKEAKPDGGRAKAKQSHRNEIRRIVEIAAGARAQAEAKRINEELKAKEKANKIRSTGKIPTTCLCFLNHYFI